MGSRAGLLSRLFAARPQALWLDLSGDRPAPADRGQARGLDATGAGDPGQAVDGLAKAILRQLLDEVEPDHAPGIAVLLGVDQAGQIVVMEDGHGEIEAPLMLRGVGLELV